MKRNVNRIISIILTVAMLMSIMVFPVSAANALSYDVSLTNSSVTNDVENTVKISLSLKETVDVCSMGFAVSVPSELELVSIEAAENSEFSYKVNLNTGKAVWDGDEADNGVDFIEYSVKEFAIVTVKIPVGTAKGNYTISISDIEIYSDNLDTEHSTADAVTATITVEEPSAPPETDPPVETDEFELYYTLNSDVNATDGYADYDMDAENGNIVVATVCLKNNPAGAAYLQAFDLYLSHHGDLIYKSTDIPGTVTAANGQLTRIQFVMSKQTEKEFIAGEDLVLGTITFEIDPNVVHDADLNITLGANTNISVGDNRAANEEETGEEIGDTTSYKPTISETLKGAEVKNTYSVTYDLDGGTGTADEQTKLYNIPLTLHSAPTKDGYTFEGWLGSDNVTYSAGQSYKVNAALKLTAQWEATKHIVKIVNGNGTTENEIAHNETITVPAADTKVGHTFDKWVDADGNTYTVGQEIIVTKALTLTAEYNVNKYEIKFVDHDGTVLKTEEVAYGDTPTAPADPSREADAQYTYTFKEWTPAITEVTDDATYTATYTATKNKYTITFVDEDGTTVLQSGDVEYGETPVYTGETPTKAATAEYTYTFKEWTPAVTAVTGEATYKATYTATKNKYTVTLNDASGESTQEVEFGTEFNAPAAADKEGHEFTGWLGSDSKTYQANEKITITGDFTLTAQYKIKSYTVTWIVDGNETVETYQFGADVTEQAAPSKDGFTFLYWSDENGEATIATKMPAENLTYTATWKVHTYTVKFDANGGTIAEGKDIADMEDVAFDAMIAMPAAEGWTKDDWVFIGWSKSDTATEAEYKAGTSYPALTAEDGVTVTLFAVWKQDEYAISYKHVDANNNTITPEITSELQPSYSSTEGLTLETPVATGYTFLGWTSEKLGIDVVTENLSIPENTIDTVDLTAHWKINKYTITFDTDGGSSVGPITQDYNTEVAAPEKPTKEGYTFDKWVDGEGQEVTFPKNMPVDGMELTAKWTINQYTITFDTVGGTAIAPIKQDYNTAVTAPADPTKTGYTFAGWDNEIPTTMPAGDMTITAQWTINQYTITFDTDGGSAVAAITQDYNTAVPAPAAPTKTGYTFAGWDTEIPATMPAGDMTITAQWTINQYTITFDTAGGSDVAAITQDYATAVPAPANPTKTGYTFAGWDTEIPATIPAENVTITAQWTINQYTITFDTDGGTAIEAITQDYNTAVTAPTAPTKTGYTFAGWDKTIPTTIPAENVTITAQWTINQYTITFDVDGGSAVAPITQNFDTAVTAPAAPTKTGYTFAGWDQNNDGTADGLPEKMPAGNLTVKAIWTATPYTITFVVTDGVEIAPMSYTIIDDKELPTATPNDATMYSFDKWVVSYAADYPEAEQGWGEAGVKVDAGSTVTNRFGNVTLTATWKKTADLFIEEYKYADNDQFLLRVKDNLGTGSVYQFNSTAMYHTTDDDYLVNSGDSGVFYILISGENLKKTDGGEYERAANGSLVLTEEAYKLLKSGTGERERLSDSCDINGDGAVNIADANIVYQMTQYTGNYYPDLSEEQRLLADQEKSTTVNHEFRASIEDVHAIVEHINTNP